MERVQVLLTYVLDDRYLTCANGIQLPCILSATGVTVYIHDFALRLELVMTVNRTRQCVQVLEAQDGNGVPIPTVVPTGAAPVRAVYSQHYDVRTRGSCMFSNPR